MNNRYYSFAISTAIRMKEQGVGIIAVVGDSTAIIITTIYYHPTSTTATHNVELSTVEQKDEE